jgi:DNA modification methylase
VSTRILIGHVLDKLAELPAESVQCCVTSPPYFGLRDYGIEAQVWPDGWTGSFGLEPTVDLYIEHLVEVFRALRRVLRRDGTLWLNLGDSYSSGSRTTRDTAAFNKGNVGAGISFRPGNSDKNKGASNRDGVFVAGSKPKDLLGVPWLAAFALRADGWWLRQDIIWSKPNPMPESVTDRPTSAHEYLFLLSKSALYHFDAEAIAELSAYPGDARHERTEIRR